jgi:hypothetical protein
MLGSATTGVAHSGEPPVLPSDHDRFDVAPLATFALHGDLGMIEMAKPKAKTGRGRPAVEEKRSPSRSRGIGSAALTSNGPLMTYFARLPGGAIKIRTSDDVDGRMVSLSRHYVLRLDHLAVCLDELTRPGIDFYAELMRELEGGPK